MVSAAACRLGEDFKDGSYEPKIAMGQPEEVALQGARWDSCAEEQPPRKMRRKQNQAEEEDKSDGEKQKAAPRKKEE